MSFTDVIYRSIFHSFFQACIKISDRPRRITDEQFSKKILSISLSRFSLIYWNLWPTIQKNIAIQLQHRYSRYIWFFVFLLVIICFKYQGYNDLPEPTSRHQPQTPWTWSLAIRARSTPNFWKVKSSCSLVLLHPTHLYNKHVLCEKPQCMVY